MEVTREWFGWFATASLLAAAPHTASADKGPDKQFQSKTQAIIQGDVVAPVDAAALGVVLVLSPAPPGEAPGTFHACTAVALSNEWLLTARHCFAPQDVATPQNVQLSLGDGTAAVGSAREILLSPTADAALIRLASPMSIGGSSTGFERRIYPLDPATLTGQTVRCLGYGANTSDPAADRNRGAGSLRTADLVISHSFNLNVYVNPNASGQAFAEGDSGGTCFVTLANGTQALVGVVAWGPPPPSGTAWVALTGPEVLRPWVANTRATQQIFVEAPDGRRCLGVLDASLTDGAQIVLRTCDRASPHQEVRLAALPGGVYELRFAHSGKCLAVPGGSMSSTPLIQWLCNGLPEQQWSLNSVSGTLYEVRNVRSGLYLDVRGGSLADASIIQYSWTGGANQRFHFEMHPGTQDHMIATTFFTTTCVDVAGANTEDSTAVIEHPCGGQENQEWRFIEKGGGCFQIQPQTIGASGKCLDVPGASRVSGTRLQQFTCFDAALNEQWRLFAWLKTSGFRTATAACASAASSMVVS